MFFFRFFSKNHQFFDFFRKPASFSLNLKVFRKPTSFSFSLNEGFFRKPTSPPLPLSFFSKTHQSSLTLKGGSTAFPKPLSPQGTGDVPTALLGAQTASL